MKLTTYTPSELTDLLFLKIRPYSMINKEFSNSLNAAIHRNKKNDKFVEQILSFLDKRVFISDELISEIKTILIDFKAMHNKLKEGVK